MTSCRKILLVGVTAISAMAAASSALAQSSASATASGSVTVFGTLALVSQSNLSFGSVLKPSAGSRTFTIDPTTGAGSISGGGTGGSYASGSSQTRAVFRATGEGGQAITFTVPATVSLGTLTLTTSNTGTGASLSGSLGGSGTADLGVGGSVDISNSTASDTYNGNIVVSVAYN